MQIGITERGDAGIDFSWVEKLNSDAIDGGILITKNLNERFMYHVLRAKKPVIVHCTCTGYGGSELEPHVPGYLEQITNCENLIAKGFPAKNIVFRIDPIFPTQKGIAKLEKVLEAYMDYLFYPGVSRIRISILDEYKHVKDRFMQKQWGTIYGNAFQPNLGQVQMVADMLKSFGGLNYEVCAEPVLANILNDRVEERGCISTKDLDIMGINYDGLALYENPQGRGGCHCLSCKTELLTHKHPCPHGCVYCYWRS